MGVMADPPVDWVAEPDVDLSPMLLTKLDWEAPEPLAALALYWKVMFVIGTSMERSAPSTLGVSALFDEEPPLFEPVEVFQVKPPGTVWGIV